RRYRALPCADRAGWDQRLWWLARPLFLLPGNDRWTEHLARMTLADILSEAGNAYGIRWGDDLREITVRFGWPVAWSAETPRLGGMGEITVVGHQGSPSVHFIPASGALEEPYAAGEGDWELRAPAPRERYAPAYADSFVAFPHQAAVFRRGESTLVVAAYELPGEAGFAGDSLAVALVLASGPGQAPVIARSSRPDGVLLAVAPAGALVLSLEALSRPARRVARARYALPTPAATPVTLSDLLLFDPADSVPPELSRVLERALPSGDLGARRRVGVYWEVYRRHGGAEPLRLDLAVRRTGGGILRRAARAVGLAEPEQPVRLEWEEVPAFESGRVARALFLDLSALGRGRYRIELTVRPADQPPLTVARDLRLGAPARP
ncbi:MAG TPA: hypothetical protein VNI61_10885, partial [Gemmatimonadales bacterium]|nr:hypothetical protein [Gemmatimonadales bacterium]